MARIALCEVSGLLTDLFQKLNGANGAAWLRKLKEILREGPFITWKTVEIGRVRSSSSIIDLLWWASVHVSIGTREILDTLKLEGQPRDLNLTMVAVSDLGFERGGEFKEIIRKALGLGLQLCPAETAPCLRLGYRDQPRGEHLLVGMEPIVNRNGTPIIFTLNYSDDDDRDNPKELSTTGGHGFFQPDWCMVFVLPPR